VIITEYGIVGERIEGNLWRTCDGGDNDVRAAGAEAGDAAGRQFMEAYGPGKAADVFGFRGGLENALLKAHAEMRERGLTQEKLDVWQAAFTAALQPHLDRYARTMSVWQNLAPYRAHNRRNLSDSARSCERAEDLAAGVHNRFAEIAQSADLKS
jgi:hypothetical protein